MDQMLDQVFELTRTSNMNLREAVYSKAFGLMDKKLDEIGNRAY